MSRLRRFCDAHLGDLVTNVALVGGACFIVGGVHEIHHGAAMIVLGVLMGAAAIIGGMR